MSAIWTSAENMIVYPFKNPTRKIPVREKCMNTVLFVVLALAMAEIPLTGGMRGPNLSQITFKSSGTLMQLGMQPFAFASMLSPFVIGTQKDGHSTDVLGFIMSCIMSAHWGMNNGWIGTVQMIAVAFGILQAEVYLKPRTITSPSTALVFANASKELVLSSYIQPVSFVWTLALMCVVSWVDSLQVTIPMAHTKARGQTVAAPLPVMYNSTSALVLYYTAVELLAHWYRPASVLISRSRNAYTILSLACLCAGVAFINTYLSALYEKNASLVVKKWKEENYSLKGWRDTKRIHKFVQRVINRNVRWNSIFICVLTGLGYVYPTSVGVTTLFIMLSTVKEQKLDLF